MKTYRASARGLFAPLDYLRKNYLKGREFLLDHFRRRRRLPRHHHQLDHGDAANRAGGKKWPVVQSLLRTAARAFPLSPRAVAEEFKLYQAELARHKGGGLTPSIPRSRPPPSAQLPH